jgi:hypothetical protein
MTETDDEVKGLRSDLRGDNDERKSLLQRIAQWVNPDMQGSKDRERDLENKLNFNKQTEFFANMTKSLAGMVVKPIRATAAGIWTFLKGIAFGGALLLLLNFLDSDTWKDWSKWLGEKLIPALKNLGKWFKKLKEDWDDDTIGAMEFMGEHLAGLLTALGVLAVVLSPFKAVGLALGLAWKVGTGWLFVAPIIALFTALGNLPKAAGDAILDRLVWRKGFVELKTLVVSVGKDGANCTYWARGAQRRHGWLEQNLYQAQRQYTTSIRGAKRQKLGGSWPWFATRAVCEQMLTDWGRYA